MPTDKGKAEQTLFFLPTRVRDKAAQREAQLRRLLLFLAKEAFGWSSCAVTIGYTWEAEGTSIVVKYFRTLRLCFSKIWIYGDNAAMRLTRLEEGASRSSQVTIGWSTKDIGIYLLCAYPYSLSGDNTSSMQCKTKRNWYLLLQRVTR